MIFLKPEYLYLMLIPLLILIVLIATNKSTLERYYSKEVLKRLKISDGSIGQKGRNIFLFLALILMIVALARPVIPKGEVNVKSSTTDILLAIDVSKSMLADDMYPNRLEFAKKRAIEFMRSFKSARFGVVAFSSAGFLVSPLSQDIPTVEYLVKNLNTDSLNLKGTDLMTPLELANKFLKNEKEKVLVIFSDGGDSKDFSKEISYAKEHNIKVYIYAVGTKRGSTIKENGIVLTDKKGNIVITRLNEEIKELALKSGGAYIVGDYTGKSIKALENAIKQKIYETNKREKKIKTYKELFYYPLWAAILFMLFGFSSIPKKRLKSVAPLFLVTFMMFVPNLKASSLFDFQVIKKADNSYKNSDYKESARLYSKLLKDKKAPEVHYDLANSLYKQKKYKEALSEYEKINSKNSSLMFKKYYNEGNAYAYLKKYDEAIKAYQKALKIDPKDEDAKYNLELIKKLKKKKQKHKNKNNKNKNSKNSKKNSKNSKKNKNGKNSKSGKNGKNDNKQNKNKKRDNKKSKQDKNNQNKKRQKQNNQEKNKAQKSKNKKKKSTKKEHVSGARIVDKKAMSKAEEKKWTQILLGKNPKTLPLELPTKPHKLDKNDIDW